MSAFAKKKGWSLLLVNVFWIVIALCSHNLRASEASNVDLDKAEVLHLLEYAEELKLLDEILTSSIITLAYSTDGKWLNRYRENADKFLATLQLLMDSEHPGVVELAQRLDEINSRLFALEGKAIAFINNQNQSLAIELLNTRGYTLEKHRLDETLQAIKSVLEDTLTRQDAILGSSNRAAKVQNKVVLTDAEKKWITENPIVIAGREDAWPPFNYTNASGEYVGISVDFIDLIAKKTGLTIQFTAPANFAALLSKLKQSELDLIPASYYSEERSDFSLHTPSYTILRDYIYFKEEAKIGKIEDLRGKKLAIPAGYATIEKVKKIEPEIDIVETDSIVDAIELVLTGEVDATMDSQSVINYYLRENALSGFGSIPSRFGSNPLRMLVTNEKPILHEIITKAIASISRAERAAILSKWFDPRTRETSSYSFTSKKLTVGELEWLNTHPVIRFAVDPAWPPYEFIDESGQYQGMVADYVELMERELGVVLDFNPTTSWEQTVDFALKKHVDILPAMSANREREENFLFTDPYVQIPSVVITREEVKDIAGLSNFSRFTLGVVKGYASTDWIKENYPQISIQEVSSIKQGLRMVSGGKLDSLLTNQLSGVYLVNELAIQNLKVNFRTEFYYNLSVAVRKDWPELIPILNKILADIDPAQKENIRNKWVGLELEASPAESVEVTEADDTLLLLIGITVISGVIFLTLAWYLSRYDVDILTLYESGKLRILVMGGLSAALILVLIVTWISLEKEELAAREKKAKSLVTVLNATQDSVNYWVRNYLRWVTQVANEPNLESLFVNLKQEYQDYPALKENLHKQMSSLKGSLFMLLNDGTPVFANTPSMDHLIERFQETVFRGRPVFIPPTRNGADGKPWIYFSAPVRNSRGEVIAAIVAQVDPEYEFSSLLTKGKIGSTGETYAVDKNALLITESRFKEQLVEISALNPDQSTVLNVRAALPGHDLNDSQFSAADQSQLTEAARRVISGSRGVQTRSRPSYLGTPVVSAWHWDKELGIGFISEISESETLEAYHLSKRTLYIVLASSLFIAFMLMGINTWIGDRATRSLLRARDQLEERVQERTTELRKSQVMTQTLLDNIPDMIFAKDLHGKYIDVNRASEEFAGKSKDKIVGFTDHEIYTEDKADRFIAMDNKMLDKAETVRFEHWVSYPDGRRVLFDTVKTPLKNDEGKIIGLLGISRDITELVEAMEAAEQANKAKSEFLANMSHEIRTPMNAILGLSHLALETELSRKQRDYIQKVNSSATSLLRIINDILDFSKIEAGKLSIEKAEFNLHEVFSDIANLFGHSAAEKEIELIFDVDPEVTPNLIGDPLRLRQIITNLISNAIKFTEAGYITIKVREQWKKEKQIKLALEVKDTGIGLTEKQAGKLFKLFSQADTSITRKYGGTGLGLTISKKLVELMGGEIGVESHRGEGSNFFFTVVFNIGKELENKIDMPATMKELSCLIVDDNEVTREVIASYLEQFKFKVSKTNSGREASTLLQSGDEKVDVVFMDWRMPDLDGISAAQEIRNNASIKNQPKIIIASAFERDALPKLVDKDEVDGYLAKPVTPSSLFDSVMRVYGLTGDNSKINNESQVVLESHVLGANILVVEDNEINQQIAKEILEQSGLNITLAENGKVALDILQEQPKKFDGVLMDMQMPVMDGLTATKKIRELSEIKDLVVIAMTANAMTRDVDECLDVGMNDHVGKPIDIDDLLGKINKWVRAKTESQATEKDMAPKIESKSEMPKNGIGENELAQIPGLNVSSILKRFGGHVDIYSTILYQFSIARRGMGEELKKAIAEKDYQSAKFTAHALKGIAGNIGAEKLYENVKKLEEQLINEAPNLALLATIIEELAQLIDAVQALFLERQDDDSGSNSNPLNNILLLCEIDNIILCLEDADPDAIEMIEKIKGSSANGDVSETINTIYKAAKNYDFDNALTLISNLKEQLQSANG